MTEKGDIETRGSDGNTPDQQLRALLGGLCKTDEDQQILAKLCEKVTAFDDETITFSDRGDEKAANYARGGAVVYNDAMPSSVTKAAGGCLWNQPLSLDYGQILLRMFSDAMIGSEYIPEIYF